MDLTIPPAFSGSTNHIQGPFWLPATIPGAARLLGHPFPLSLIHYSFV